MVVGMKRIKQYGIWLRLLMKRLLKQPVFIGLLLLIPVMGYAVSTLEQGGSSGAVVAVCVEESRWSEQIVTKLQALSADNTAGSSVLQYHFYDSDMETERAVLKSEADCGFVIPGDIAERVMEEDWRNGILVYETNSSSITGMAKERIAGVLFQLYSEESYEAYLEETVQAEDFITDDEAKEIVAFARQAYETHLVDGSTFSFVYERQGEALAVDNSDINNDDRMSQEKSDRNVTNDTSVFPVKGVFAVLIFISGMCGMLEYEKDKKEKRFLRLAPNWMTYIVNIWIPTLYTSLAVLVCLWITDALQLRACSGGTADIPVMGEVLLGVWSPGMWGKQIGSLILYQGIIVLYCCILRVLLRRQETIAVAIPIMTLGSLVCAPVFVRLSMYMPLFEVLEKLFPATYYLMM